MLPTNLNPIVAAIAVVVTSLVAGAARAETVIIATEAAYPPFNATAADGTFTGFEIEYGNAVCAAAGLECEWVKQDFSGMIPALLTGRYDVILSAMSINDERERAAAFSLPYMNDSFRLYGPMSFDGALPDALQGKTIGVFTGSTGERFVEETWGDLVETRGYDNIDQVNADLAAGRIDFGFNSQLTVADFLESPEGADYDFIGPVYDDPILGRGMGVMFRKDGTELKARFDEAIRATYTDGTFDALARKHFGEEVDIRADGLW